jgi:hypothetical protein
MAHRSTDIFCDGNRKRFFSLDSSSNIHLLRISNFLCISHCMFVLGTLILISTNSITRKLPLITLLIVKLTEWFLYYSIQQTFLRSVLSKTCSLIPKFSHKKKTFYPSEKAVLWFTFSLLILLCLLIFVRYCWIMNRRL